jgi:hypothetical protein
MPLVKVAAKCKTMFETKHPVLIVAAVYSPHRKYLS